MNEKATVSKELDVKHRKILEALFKLPENRECAECKSKGPRWASVNLGIFICMQCSGIHRSLGVHISKVRSATLDTWLPDQVAYIKSMGNEKSNNYWEAELPSRYERVGIENFIRAKYVDKRWIPKDGRARPTVIIKEEKDSVNKFGLEKKNTNGYSNGIKQTVEVKKIPQPPNTIRRSSIHKINGPTLDSRPQEESHKKAEIVPSEQVSETRVAVLKPEAEMAIVIKKESETRILEKKPELAVSSSRVGSPAISVSSSPKVDYAADLFNLIYMDSGEKSPNPCSINGFSTEIQSSERTLRMEESVQPKPVEAKKKTDCEIHDMFQGLEWVTPQPANKLPEPKINCYTNVFDKPSMTTPYPVQQQFPFSTQQQPFVATTKPFGAPQTTYGNVNQQGFNNFKLPSKHWGNNGNYGSGMMMMRPLAELQKHSQMGNTQPSYPAGNFSQYTTSSLSTRGPSTVYSAPSSIPAHLGGEYDFSSLMQGMFVRR